MFRKILAVLAILAGSVAPAQSDPGEGVVDGCEFTEEYKRAKWEFQKPLKENWQECQSSIVQANYWYAFSQCLQEQEKLPELTVICGRDAAHNSERYLKFPISSEHCASFRLDSALAKRELEKEVERRGIAKCK